MIRFLHLLLHQFPHELLPKYHQYAANRIQPLLPFSAIYKLFQEVTNRGWEWRTLLGPDSLGLAWYIPSVKEMLHQRKRWLIGARELPLNWKGMIILYGLFIPVVLAIFWFNPRLAFAIWISKFLVQSVFIIFLCLAAERRPFSFLYLIVYEFYVILNTAATAIFYWLPIKSIWKGREYNLSSFGTISPEVEITQDDK